MRRIHVDAEKCAGCRFCEMLCSFHHERKFSSRLSRVRVLKDDKLGLDYPVICQQCDSCPPSDVCPTRAFRRTDEGVVRVVRDECVACQRCVASCTFEAVRVDGSSMPLVCDLCEGDPICVERCPTKALEFTETFSAEHREEASRRLLRRWGIGS